MKPTIHKYIGVGVVIALASLFVNTTAANDSSARLDAYKGNKLIPENFQIDTNNPASAESVAFSKSSMTWSVGLGNSLQSKFAGFMDLTFDEWNALEDSNDKYLFGVYVAMGNITDAKMTPEEARQDAVMDPALSYWEANNTKLPSDLDISWVCCPPSLEFWRLNMDNFSCWMQVGSISASDFANSRAQLSCDAVSGINSENINSVLSCENCTSGFFSIEDQTTFTFSQFEALCQKVERDWSKYNPLTDNSYSTAYSYEPFSGNFSISTSDSDNLSGVTNWIILENRVPDSVYNQFQTVADCKGKNFSWAQLSKIRPKLSGAVDPSLWDQPCGFRVDGSELTNYEAGLCGMPD